MRIEHWTDEQGRLFLKTFLIDTSKNDRGWKVTPEAIDTFANTFIGKPVTLMKNKEESLFGDYHPFSPETNAPVIKDIQFAERYGVGHITDVIPSIPERLSANSEGDPSYKAYDAIWEVQDPIVKAELLKEDTQLVPPEVSPGIVWFEGTRDGVEEFTGVHLALVPKGAYGPRAKQIAKCEGGPVACRTELLRASSINVEPTYEQRTGGCPLGALSSIVNDSGSSNTVMSSVSSFTNSSPHGAPAPRTIGTNSYRSPTGSVMATQASTNSGYQVQSQSPQSKQPQSPQGKLQITIKSPKLFLGNKKLSTPEEEEKEKQPNPQPPIEPVEVKTNTDVNTPTQSNAVLDSSVLKDYENTKKEVDIMKRKWDLQFAIPHEIFVDKNGKFMRKEWEKEIERVAGNLMPLEMVEDYYRNKAMAMKYQQMQEQVATVPDKKKNTGKLGASMTTTTDSSQDNAELDNVVKCLRLMRGFN